MIPIAARNAAVYPRWRGEHDKSLTKNNSTPGLSPLARGTHHYFGKSVIKNRFIPAGAGNTISVMLKDIAGSVYPRWRGEHWQNKHRGTRGAGLSPLARGTLDQAVLFFQRRRFIPAGAGNTQKQNTETAVPAVYPRWRGEHDEITLTTEQKRGLSPLARGTRAAVVPGGRCRRFIPAGAGNT